MGRPNILLCVADDAGMHMGAYGCTWVNTPGFDRVARDGVLFSNAYTPNAKCAPSRACILTGRNSWQLEEAANHIAYFPAKFKTYVEALKEHGYFVGFTSKGWAPGDPGEIDGKPRELTGKRYDDRTTPPPTPCISPLDYAENFRAFLAEQPQDQPFCFWFGAREPHRKYEYGSGAAKGGKSVDDIDRVYGIWPDTEVVRTDLLDYAFEVEHFDQHLTKMLAMLEERGELDNTLVVVTSDNGMPFPRVKGQEYEYSNHLPLAVMWGNGVTHPGRRVDDFVSFIDFAPTFLEAAGVDSASSGMQPIEGRSLTDLLSSQQSGQVNPQRDHVLIGKERHDVGRPNDAGYPIRAIIKDGFIYLRNFCPDRWPAGNPETGYMNCDASPTKTECLKARHDPETRHFWQWSFGKRPAEELYHIAQDPDCLNNLADQPEHEQRKAALRAQMEAELKAQGDPRMFGNGHIFDDYQVSNPTQVGFYERFMEGDPVKAGWISQTDIDPPDC